MSLKAGYKAIACYDTVPKVAEVTPKVKGTTLGDRCR